MVLMSKDNFPRIMPLGDYEEVVAEWDNAYEAFQWINANMQRFVFGLEEIKGRAAEYHAFDGPDSVGVYFLLYECEVVYVGKAHTLSQRLLNHYEQRKKIWTHFWCIRDIHPDVVDKVEYLYIKWLNPVFNTLCRGQTDAADLIIAGLEPYPRPFIHYIRRNPETGEETHSLERKDGG